MIAREDGEPQGMRLQGKPIHNRNLFTTVLPKLIRAESTEEKAIYPLCSHR